MSEQKNKRIYLDYCQKSNTRPLPEILALFDEGATRCELVKQDNPIQGERPIDDRAILSLSVVLSENLTNFRELTLSNYMLNPAMLTILAAGLENNKYLVKLTLQNNFIDSAGLDKLLNGLSDNQSIAQLDLSQNRIKDKGAERLSLFLRTGNRSVKSLAVCQNLIETDYLGEALAIEQQVEFLDLSYNNYTAESFEILFKGLRSNMTLEGLDLRGMSLAANINAIALCELFLKNKRLRHLYVDIDFSLLDEKMLKDLESSLLQNVSMQSFRSIKYELHRDDEITGGLYKILRANQWISNNFEKLCNNEVADCDESLQEIVKHKLEIMSQNANNSFSSPRSFAELLSPKCNSKSPGLDSVARVLYPNANSLNKRIHPTIYSENNPSPSFQLDKSVDELLQDTNIRDLNSVDASTGARTYAPEQFDLPKQLTEYIDAKIERVAEQVLQNQQESNKRTEALERKVNLLLNILTDKVDEDQPFDGEESTTCEALKDNDESLRKPHKLSLSFVRKNLADLQTTFTLEASNNSMKGFMDDRLKFESEAHSSFGDIFSKLQELNQMLSQVGVSSERDHKPANEGGYYNSAYMTNERERLENLVTQKIEQIFTARLRTMDGGNHQTMFNPTPVHGYLSTNEDEESSRVYATTASKRMDNSDKMAVLSSSKKKIKENPSLKHYESPNKRSQGHPMSMKELTMTPVGKLKNRSAVKPKPSGSKNVLTQSKKKETSAKLELPDSIKKVKEQIRMKIDSYKQVVSQFEKDREYASLNSPANKMSSTRFVKAGTPNGYSKSRTNSMEVVYSMTGQHPSPELIETLMNKGFNFDRR